MEEFQLPIEPSPPMQSYLHYAFPLSVLMTNPYYTDWILNHFIQMVYDPSHTCPYDYHEPLYVHWPCLSLSILYPDMIRRLSDAAAHIRGYLQDGWYCAAWVNCAEIPGTRRYGDEPHIEGLLLYGYGPEGFSAMMYGKHYYSRTVGYAEFLRSLQTDLLCQLQFFRINPRGVDYRFLRIQKKLKSYLDSQDYDLDDHKYHNQEVVKAFGAEACRQIIPYLMANTGAHVDERWPCVFCEHKRLMMFRIEKIMESYAIPGYPFTAADREQLIKDANRVLLLCMKHNMSPTHATGSVCLETACQWVEKVLQREREMLEPIVAFDYLSVFKKESASLIR
ncbi:MAG: hypothetical protein HFJ80_02305 [Clostridiales bacterium]|nr:hypothetical protein [Clostridiales bacterium]